MLSLVSDELLAILADHAAAADADKRWPDASWSALQRAGVLRWLIPKEQGGLDLSAIDLLEGYELLGTACQTTAFILSQREAACRRIRDSHHTKLLAPLARGDILATIGLSHLTTSRQHAGPAVTVRMDGDDFVLDGIIPWVTGAARADYIITGGTLDDGRQILAVCSRELPGVQVGPPLDLMALAGSLTTEVTLKDARLDRRWLLAGPVERVMTVGRVDTGGLETSCLALALTRSAVDYLKQQATLRPELRGIAEALDAERHRLREEMHRLAAGDGNPESATALRGNANTLVLRATQAALTVSKGAGFVSSHPAQRWARQAMFFLVWSCPRPAVDATLAYLAGPVGPHCA